jgi:hypothetical protein
MVRVFRTLIVFSIVALGVALVLPLQHTVSIRVSLSAPPPAVLFLAPAMLLVGIATLVAAVALLMFRRWGRWLGALALLGGLAVSWFASARVAGFALAVSAQVLLVLSALAWLGCLLASHHPKVAARFQHAH